MSKVRTLNKKVDLVTKPCDRNLLNEEEIEEHALFRWLIEDHTNVARHVMFNLTENEDNRQSEMENLREIVRSHYVDPQITANRIASLGAPKTAELFREILPTTKTARSGDLGEIFAAEIAEFRLSYNVPIRRLRLKDGRNRALYGDDILGISRGNGQLRLLKGESKSRSRLTADVLNEAGSTLDSEDGRPSRLSVLFVALRLREQGENELAFELESGVVQSFDGVHIEHMLFVLCGNDPRDLLVRHLETNSGETIRRLAVSVYVSDHAEFIDELYQEL